MTRSGDPSARAARLAAKLRENLHRRKAQSREQAGGGGPGDDGDRGDSPQDGLPKPGSAR